MLMSVFLEVGGREEERGEDAGRGGQPMGEVEERVDVALRREGEEEHVWSHASLFSRLPTLSHTMRGLSSSW